MPNIRPLNQHKYEISKHRFYELYHMCLQYNEWKDELKYKNDTLASPSLSGLPTSSGIGDSTSMLAVHRAELRMKCERIEQTAIETDPELCPYLLKAVTNEQITYKYLKSKMNIPCGKNMYYDRRRKFYWLLSKKI